MTDAQFDKMNSFGRKPGDDGFGSREPLPHELVSFTGISDLDFGDIRVEASEAYDPVELRTAMAYAAKKDILHYEDRILDPAFATKCALDACQLYLEGTNYNVAEMVGNYFVAIADHFVKEDVELATFNEQYFAFLDTVDLEASNSDALVCVTGQRDQWFAPSA